MLYIGTHGYHRPFTHVLSKKIARTLPSCSSKTKNTEISNRSISQHICICMRHHLCFSYLTPSPFNPNNETQRQNKQNKQRLPKNTPRNNDYTITCKMMKAVEPKNRNRSTLLRFEEQRKEPKKIRAEPESNR